MEVRAERGEREGQTQGRGLHAVSRADDQVRSLLTRDYVGFTETARDGQRWVEPPRPAVTMILNLSDAFGGFPDAFVAGIADSATVVTTAGGTSCIDLKLTPLGAFAVLGISMYELAGRIVDLRAVLGRDAQPFLDALREQSAWASRFGLVDALLTRRVAHGPRPAERVRWAWERLVASGGQLAIGRIAAEVGWTRKHLIKMFKEQIGLPPKAAGRLLRFHSLVRRMDQEPLQRWADAAAASGYSDQSHLIRDFQRFTGETPGRYARRIRMERAAAGDQVNFVQDFGPLPH